VPAVLGGGLADMTRAVERLAARPPGGTVIPVRILDPVHPAERPSPLASPLAGTRQERAPAPIQIHIDKIVVQSAPGDTVEHATLMGRTAGDALIARVAEALEFGPLRTPRPIR
jgi:hypothetical protein